MIRSFLFLQGPISPFFRELGAALAARGHAVRRINLSLGDRLFWNDARSEDFTGAPEDWAPFLRARLEGVTDLVLLGEQRPLHRVAIALAKRRGIAVTATDYGYLRPDWIALERGGMNGLSRFPRDRAGILALATASPPVPEEPAFRGDFARQARWDMMFHLASLLPWRFPRSESFLLHSPIPAYLGTGWRLLRRPARARAAERLLAALPPGAPVFVFAMQMETDYSIRAYSPFRGMEDALEVAVRSFAAHAAPEARLLVKPHPLDPGLRPWRARVAALARAAGAEGRVHLVDAPPLDPLLRRAAGLVTVNSTSGVRAIQLGCPVLGLGDAVWRVEGLSHEDGLESFWTAPRRPDPVLADAFLRAIAKHVHLRGDFYAEGARRVAVQAAADRLEEGAGPPALIPSPRPRLAAARPQPETALRIAGDD